MQVTLQTTNHCSHCKAALKRKSRLTVMVSFCFHHRNLPDILPRLTSAFEVDLLLKRTFLHTIPVWELDEIVASKMFLISDICVALVTYCYRELVPADKVRMFSNRDHTNSGEVP